MRVLLLTQKLPLPIEDGYNLRIHHYARRIGRRHSLTLLSLDDGAISSEQETFFRRVVRAPLRKGPAPGLGPGRLIRALDPSNLHDRDPGWRGASGPARCNFYTVGLLHYPVSRA